MTSPQPLVSEPNISNEPESSNSPPRDGFSARKHAHEVGSSLAPAIAAGPEHKKRRIESTPDIRHRIRSLSGPLQASAADPISPLFFSQGRHATRPSLPPRFSSGEAGSKMLSKAYADESTVKTVTLARGSYSEFSPPAPRFLNFTSQNTSEKSSLPSSGSPDGLERSEITRLLSQIGIIELLEQDTRPTFIVDLSDTQVHVSGFLQVIFANGALRSIPAVFGLVRTHGDTQFASSTNTPVALSQFQQWVLAMGSRSDSHGVPLSFPYGGMLWSRSTLRKRLRVVSAASAIASSWFSPGVSTPHARPIANEENTHDRRFANPIGKSHQEPSDYFGNAMPTESEKVTNSDAAMVAKPEPQGSDSSRFRLVKHEAHVDLTEALNSPSFTNQCVSGVISRLEPNPAVSPTRDVGFFDWTRLPLDANLPRHISFARSINWASTALGPIEFWPPDLRQMCNLVMASPHPAAMYWGDDLVVIYNEAYVMLAGQKHPWLMGQSYREAWAEIWDDVKEVFANAKQTGQATMKDDNRLFMKRSNYLEETYFSWSIIPMVGANGTVSGLYNPSFEKTRRKIAERRMLTLREVGERTANARDVRSFWQQLASALDTNENDTPFLLLYSVADDMDNSDLASTTSNSYSGSKQCYLEGSLGVPSGHPCAASQIDLKGGVEGFGPLFREVLKADKSMLLRVINPDEADASDASDRSPLQEPDPEDLADYATLEVPSKMLEGIEWRGFGDPCRSVVICPIRPTTGETVLGFLVLGVNPRRPYDEDYSLFVQLLNRQLAASLASVVLFEEEIKRGQKAAKLAALDRIELSQQLAARTQEARDIETRFTRMAEFSPAGLFIANSRGQITYCNDTWYEIAGIRKDPECADNWIDYVEESDQAYVRGLWEGLVEHLTPITAEFRFKSQWRDDNNNKSDTWVLFSAYPEKSSDDTQLKSVFGNITNISTQKWAQGFQKRKMEEAVELKRQQENFIDITSHEMRNPLSAILQCADEVSASLGEINLSKTSAVDREAIENSLDAAKTILLCAQHQKRIVDDVLTLSKLGSHMLIITPVDAQPLTIVQRVLKMFEGETQSVGIDMKLTVHDSFKELAIDWVKLDPQRVVQVLINLTTNAIKFTSNADGMRGSIYVSIAASLTRPSLQANPRVQYFRSQSKIDEDLVMGPDWGNGEEVYIQFAVEDTGPGLTVEEKKILFNRFAQASPRTHVQYGGSGLGLFISRELTELQGGEIGVASEAGKGSTFAFYVQSRRSTQPQNTELAIPALLKSVESKGRRSEKGSASTKNERRNITVLIVEDNVVNQKVLQRQLQHLGFVVHVANHGGEALDMLRESKFWKQNSLSDRSATGKALLDLTIVLMDQEMPIMDGMECTKAIRHLEAQRQFVDHVPIIGVTANARKEQIEALLDAGMDDVVSKPFRIPELVPKVEELATRYAKRELSSAHPGHTK